MPFPKNFFPSYLRRDSFTTPHWFHFLDDARGILYMDELPRAKRKEQRAVTEALLGGPSFKAYLEFIALSRKLPKVRRKHNPGGKRK